jgi:ABC-type multidrug transport system ATPase subunit
MPSILNVQDLQKKYGDFTAVKGISFDIREGEIFSLLGPNGAGKTTTISMLSTLYTIRRRDDRGTFRHERPDGSQAADRRGAAGARPV